MTSLREHQKACAYIDELFMDKNFHSIKEDELLIKILCTHAVSEDSIKKFINRYVVMGIISINKGLIIKNKGEN